MPADQRVRVAFVVHVMQVAGAEVLVAETIRQLTDSISPVVFCLDRLGPLGEQLRDEGVPVIVLGRRPQRDYAVAWRMAGEVRRRGIAVIHAHQYTPFFYSALARVFSGTNPAVILTEHGRHYPDVVSPLRRWSNRLVLRHLASRITGVCEFSATSLAANDGFDRESIGVIENGIEFERYHSIAEVGSLRSRLGLQADRRYVGNVARFHPVKDQATLLRAFRIVADTLSDADLVLVGDGPLRQELEALTSELSLEGRVRFLGVRADVPDILAALDVFVLTSLSEAASITLLEAMASALPSIVTDVGGNSEIVQHDVTGMLVGRGDTTSIAAAILAVLSDSALARRLGAAARRRVEAVYGLQRTIARYDEMYRELGAAP